MYSLCKISSVTADKRQQRERLTLSLITTTNDIENFRVSSTDAITLSQNLHRE
jgi:hypothetical protein